MIVALARVAENAYGKCLIATGPVATGVAVAQFSGPIVAWSDVPEAEVRHALLIDDRNWLIPTTDARWVNHACEPNCTVDDDLRIVTARPVAAGEEFTISYNDGRRSDFLAHPESFFWDARWSFDCACGARTCQGRIAGYRLLDG